MGCFDKTQELGKAEEKVQKMDMKRNITFDYIGPSLFSSEKHMALLLKVLLNLVDSQMKESNIDK